MKKVLKIVVGLLCVFIVSLFVACSDNNQQADNNVQQDGEAHVQKVEYVVAVRSTQFINMEDVTFLSDGKAVEATYQDGKYSFSANRDFSKIQVVKDGFRFGEVFEYHAEDYSNPEVVHKYMVAAPADSEIDFSKPFGFHGKVADRTGDGGLNNAVIKVGDVTVFVTDSTGNFDIPNLFEETWFSFACEGYVLNPSLVCVTEETEAYYVREVVQD